MKETQQRDNAETDRHRDTRRRIDKETARHRRDDRHTYTYTHTGHQFVFTNKCTLTHTLIKHTSFALLPFPSLLFSNFPPLNTHTHTHTHMIFCFCRALFLVMPGVFVLLFLAESLSSFVCLFYVIFCCLFSFFCCVFIRCLYFSWWYWWIVTGNDGHFMGMMWCLFSLSATLPVFSIFNSLPLFWAQFFW